MDNKLEGWVTEHGGVSFCPACRTKVEKNEGCNHMTCIYCKYEFCWFCRGWAGPGSDHFNPINPASCGAGQFDRTASRNIFLNYLRFFFVGILFIVLSPIVYVLWIVFMGFFLPAIFMEACLNRTKNPIIYLVTLPFGMLAALVIGLVIAPFAALVYIFTILYGIYAAIRFCCLKILRALSRSEIDPQEMEHREAALRRLQEKIEANAKLVE